MAGTLTMRRGWIAIGVALISFVPLLCAQQKESRVPINIRVIDPSGAVVWDACVSVVGPTNDSHFSKKTDSHGLLPTALRPGNYDITVRASGFNKATTRLQVERSSPPSLEIKLAVGSCSPCVEVGSAPLPPQLDVGMETSKSKRMPAEAKNNPKTCNGCDCTVQNPN
jgi:hypothetical protein